MFISINNFLDLFLDFYFLFFIIKIALNLIKKYNYEVAQ